MMLKAISALLVCLMPAFCSEPLSPGHLAEDNRRAATLAAEGRLDEAAEMFGFTYAQALRAGESGLAAQAAGYLGTLCRFQGQAARGIPLLRFAKSQFAPGSTDAALVSAQLGAALAQDGDLPGAERELRSAGANLSARSHLAAVLMERKSLQRRRRWQEKSFSMPLTTTWGASACAHSLISLWPACCWPGIRERPTCTSVRRWTRMHCCRWPIIPNEPRPPMPTRLSGNANMRVAGAPPGTARAR